MEAASERSPFSLPCNVGEWKKKSNISNPTLIRVQKIRQLSCGEKELKVHRTHEFKITIRNQNHKSTRA